MKIRIWSDFACPFCYIGETSLLRAAAELGLTDIDLEFKAFELDPSMPEGFTEPAPAHFMRVAGLNYEHAMGRIAKVSRFARMAGLDFNYANAMYCRTLDAHRLVKYTEAVDHTRVQNVVQRLFAAFFTCGLDISDREVLASIAADEGLEPAKVREMLRSTAYTEEVRSDEAEARLLGLDTVPYTFIDSCQPVRGSLSVDGFKKVLTAAADAPANSSHICGPDGCLL